MAMNIGAIALDAFMVLVIVAGLMLLAAMVREELPHRRGTRVRTRTRSSRTGSYARHARLTNHRAA